MLALGVSDCRTVFKVSVELNLYRRWCCCFTYCTVLAKSGRLKIKTTLVLKWLSLTWPKILLVHNMTILSSTELQSICLNSFWLLFLQKSFPHLKLSDFFKLKFWIRDLGRCVFELVKSLLPFCVCVCSNSWQSNFDPKQFVSPWQFSGQGRKKEENSFE